MSQFHFLRPYCLIALIPLIYCLWYLYHSTRPTNIWSKVCDQHLLPHLLVGRWKQQHRYSLIFLGSAWGLAVLAMAGPTWSHLPAPVYQSSKATVIAIDLSDQMLAEDIKPNRLTRAKFKTLDILQHVREGQVGLLAFSSDAFVVSPLTDDALTITDLVGELDPSIMPVQGNSLGDALDRSARLLTDMNLTHGHIILVTATSPTEDEKRFAQKLHKQGLTISVLGVGTPGGAPVPTSEGFMRTPNGDTVIAQLDELGLKGLAERGGGIYERYQSDGKDITALLNVETGHRDYGLQKNDSALTDKWLDQGPHLLLLLLPLVALSFRRGWMESLLRS